MYCSSHCHQSGSCKSYCRTDQNQNPANSRNRILHTKLNSLVYRLQYHTKNNLHTSQNQRKVEHLLVVQRNGFL